MLVLDDLMSLLNDFMADVGQKDPHMPNGLQVRGREEIKLLVTGVSASLPLFEEAVAGQDGVRPPATTQRSLVRDRQLGYD